MLATVGGGTGKVWQHCCDTYEGSGDSVDAGILHNGVAYATWRLRPMKQEAGQCGSMRSMTVARQHRVRLQERWQHEGVAA